jgi:hypothetical protein
VETAHEVGEFLSGFTHDLVTLFEETEKYIVPHEREEFAVQFKLAILNSKIDLVKQLSKEAKPRSNGGWAKIQKEVHESHAEWEKELRRLELENPVGRESFVNNLKWLTEHGVERDLAGVRTIKRNPPYASEEISGLLEIAEQRICERINDPDHVSEPTEDDQQRRDTSVENAQDVGWATFQRELPRLLKEAPGKWVAFHRDRQAALSTSKQEVYERLLQMKCPLEEVVVRRIKPLGPPVNLQRLRRA